MPCWNNKVPDLFSILNLKTHIKRQKAKANANALLQPSIALTIMENYSANTSLKIFPEVPDGPSILDVVR